MSRAIEDYALIGDCTTAGLTSRNGSIDWLCWPRFDSSPCFAALLGYEEHGHWQVAPLEEFTAIRRYLDGTLVLVTTLETDEGVVELNDFMPLGCEESHVVRGVAGRVVLRSRLSLRFDYGTSVPWMEALQDGAVRAISGPEMVLRSPVEHRIAGQTAVAEFSFRPGDTLCLTLSHLSSHLRLRPA